jgi:8-oxo-dGTP pyrophosphatase MutT (NUDIX family)
VCFGGVCGVGEPDPEAACRELVEEAGVEAVPGELRELGRGRYEDADVAALATVYELRHGGPFSFPDGEVEEVRWVPLDGLDAFLATHEHCPDSASLLRSIDPWGTER